MLRIRRISGRTGGRRRAGAGRAAAAARGRRLHRPHAAGPRAGHRHPRRVRGRRRGDRDREDVRGEPRRRRRDVRDPVRRGVRRPRSRAWASARRWPATCPGGGCSGCRSSSPAPAWCWSPLMPHLALSLICVIGVGFGAGTAYLAGATLLGREVADEVRGPDVRLRAVAGPGRPDPHAGRGAVPGRRCCGSARSTSASSTFTVDGARILLALAGLLAIAGGRRVLPADGRPARRADGAGPGQRAARRHHHPPPAVEGRHAHRLRGRRGVGQVDAGAQAGGVADRATGSR